MFRAAATAGAVVLVLAACSPDAVDDPATTDPAKPEATSVVEDLTGDDLCAALSGATIEQALGVPVEDSEGIERGRAPVMRTPYFLSRTCDYDTGGQLPALTTALSSEWDEETSDEEVLDAAFTDVTAEPEAVGPYEDLPDLGVLAGFGDDALLAKAEVAGQVLGVVLRIGEERLMVKVSTTGRATLDQLRPLADELVANLESAMTPG